MTSDSIMNNSDSDDKTCGCWPIFGRTRKQSKSASRARNTPDFDKHPLSVEHKVTAIEPTTPRQILNENDSSGPDGNPPGKTKLREAVATDLSPIDVPKSNDVHFTVELSSAADSSEGVPIKESAVQSRPTNQRSRAEERFREAAKKLGAVLPTEENPIQIPDALTLKNLDQVDDIEGTGKQLEKAIESLMSARKELKSDRTTRQTVGDCINRWFQASFPYIKPTLNVVGELLPSPYAMPINAFVFLLQTTYDAGQKAEEVEGALVVLSAAIHKVQVTAGFSDVLTPKQLDDVDCAALNLSASVTEYLAMAIKYFVNKSIKDHVTNVLAGKTEFTSAREEIDKCVMDYNYAMGSLTATIGGELLRHDKDHERKAILDWIWGGKYWDRHVKLCEDRIANTGSWILETLEFRNWQLGEAPSIICHGMPGAGKSILTSLVLENFLKYSNSRLTPRVGVVFFYFDYENASSLYAVDVIRALLKQLVYQLDSIPPEVARAYNEATTMGAQPKRKSFIELFMSCSRRFSKVYIILDAYDECLDKEREFLNPLLQRFDDARTIFTYVTSREHLRGSLRDIFTNALLLEIRATSQDVTEYIIQKLAGHRSVKNDAFKKKIIEKISSSADGMFLLTQLQLEHVLRQAEPRKMETALNSLPKTLGSAYELIITRLKQNESQLEFVMKVCTWICNSVRPLRKAELIDLLVVWPGDNELQRDSRMESVDIIEQCQGLVIYDEASGTWRLTHYTVQEFLLSSKQLLPASYLAETCLTYISFDSFGQGMCPDPVSLEERLASYPALRYVASHWGHHINDAKPLPTEMVERVLKTYLSEAIRYSIMQVAPARRSRSVDPNFTLLHFLASARLVNVCRILDHDLDTLVTKYDIPQSQLDINAKDVYDWTPLHCAAFAGDLDTMMALIEKGADVNAETAGGMTVFHLAATHGGNKELLVALLDKGVNVNARTKTGWTALHSVVRFTELEEITRMLLKRGADVTIQDNSGWTALNYMVRFGGPEIIFDELLRRSADIGSQATELELPITYVAFAGAGNIRWAEMPCSENLESPNEAENDINRHELYCRIFPDDYVGHYLLAEAYRKRDRLSDAGSCYDKCIDTNPLNFNLTGLDDVFLRSGIICDGCAQLLRGLRYRCSTCPNFDFCMTCYKSDQPKHPVNSKHQFLQIPSVEWISRMTSSGKFAAKNHNQPRNAQPNIEEMAFYSVPWPDGYLDWAKRSEFV